MNATAPFRVGQALINEPMCVETVAAVRNGDWVVGLVGAQSERFRRVAMSEADLTGISALSSRCHRNAAARC
jgi:hypothetical protein